MQSTLNDVPVMFSSLRHFFVGNQAKELKAISETYSGNMSKNAVDGETELRKAIRDRGVST